MIVNRRTWIAKKGCMDKVIAETLAVFKQLGPPWDKARIYVECIAPFDQFGCEVEFESLAQYEQMLNDCVSRTPADFWPRWRGLIEPGGTNEIWTLVENK
jgi:hypothetical protein